MREFATVADRARAFTHAFPAIRCGGSLRRTMNPRTATEKTREPNPYLCLDKNLRGRNVPPLVDENKTDAKAPATPLPGCSARKGAGPPLQECSIYSCIHRVHYFLSRDRLVVGSLLST